MHWETPAAIPADEGDLEGFRMAMLKMFEIRGTGRQQSGWIQPVAENISRRSKVDVYRNFQKLLERLQ